jgi:hypothetical protein
MSVEWISQLREIVVDSLERSWLPFPIKEDLCEGWKKDLQVGPAPPSYIHLVCTT